MKMATVILLSEEVAELRLHGEAHKDCPNDAMTTGKGYPGEETRGHVHEAAQGGAEIARSS